MREASLPRSPTCSLSTSPSLFALCSRRPAEEEHEKHMGAGVVEPELVARTGFFAQEKWQESFLPKLVRKRAANGAQRRSLCVYFLKSSQMQYDNFQLATVRSAQGQGGLHRPSSIPLTSPDTEDGQISPPNVVHDLGSLDCEGLGRSSPPPSCLQASPLALQSITLSALVVCKVF